MFNVSGLFEKAKVLTLPTYICISIGLIVACAVLFPDRLPSLLGFINRLFIGTVFVYALAAVSKSIKPEDMPTLLVGVFVGAGMAV